MRYIEEVAFKDFNARPDAQETLDIIEIYGDVREFQHLLEDLFPNLLTYHELNDFLAFNDEWIFEQLGIKER